MACLRRDERSECGNASGFYLFPRGVLLGLDCFIYGLPLFYFLLRRVMVLAAMAAVAGRAVAAHACSTPVWPSCGVSAGAMVASRVSSRSWALGICVSSSRLVCRLVCASRAVLLVAVRFAAARRCLFVMPSRRSVVRIVICLICGVSSSSLLCRADA